MKTKFKGTPGPQIAESKYELICMECIYYQSVGTNGEGICTYRNTTQCCDDMACEGFEIKDELPQGEK